MFEVFISYKDNKEYLVSPNNKNYNLEIFALINNKKIKEIEGHNDKVSTIRYFINIKNNNNEYLISADNEKKVFIWDINNDYKIIHKIETKYEDYIYSCLLIFPFDNNDNYIITSTYKTGDNPIISATKIYSLNNIDQFKYINNTNNNSIFYLLSWYNKKNEKYYIIQLSEKIIINNLFEDELYSELKQDPEGSHLNGFIYNKNNNDYLCCSSDKGCINIWNLYEKNLFKKINIQSEIVNVIQWNYKYFIAADYINKNLKVIDLDKMEIVSNIGEQNDNKIKCIKKINHPIFGESLLISNDTTIKLLSI